MTTGEDGEAQGIDEAIDGAPSARPRGLGEILVVDDDQTTCELVEATLRPQSFDVTWRTSPEAALDLLAERDFDVVLTDLQMDRMDGIEVCERILGTRPDVPVIVVTGHGSMEAAVSAIRVGAFDFVTKPIDSQLLALIVRRALQHGLLRGEVRRLRRAVDLARPLDGIVGESAAMRRVYDLVRRVADSDATVLVSGESGTGKELFAKALHRESSRRHGPFLAINCAAVPPTLLESELFGHARGAFTDAKSTRTGLFVDANGGTLLLDEIAEMPLEMQPKILRALQERKVRPVGGATEIAFDARIVAATNRDLEAECAEKRFREDLYYRVNVVRLVAPPLRDRGSDVLLLARHFAESFAAHADKAIRGLSEPAAEKLVAYDWPGNVRELENCIERAVALTQSGQIGVEDLPEKIREYRASRLVVETEDPAELVSADELEERYVRKVLAVVGGNKSRAAEILGFDRRTLYRKLERYQRAS